MAKDRFKLVEDIDVPAVGTPTLLDALREFFDTKHLGQPADVFFDDTPPPSDSAHERSASQDGFFGSLWSGISSFCSDFRKQFDLYHGQGDVDSELDAEGSRKVAKNR